MILFVSDIHFGRADAAAERAKEADLTACLRAHADRTEALFLLGDVFDQYIEYRHLVPKGFVRFQGLLAEWTDRGVPVTYLVGNHDPWHRDYFARELGVRLVLDTLTEPLSGRVVHMAHGDGATASAFERRLRAVLRHPLPVRLYRTLLPGDAGFGLARWVNRHFHEETVDTDLVEALRVHARHLLTTTEADLVVMGHGHYPEHWTWPEGEYLNPGGWHERRTFGALDAAGVRLLRWNGTFSAVQ